MSRSAQVRRIPAERDKNDVGIPVDRSLDTFSEPISVNDPAVYLDRYQSRRRRQAEGSVARVFPGRYPHLLGSVAALICGVGGVARARREPGKDLDRNEILVARKQAGVYDCDLLAGSRGTVHTGALHVNAVVPPRRGQPCVDIAPLADLPIRPSGPPPLCRQ